MPEPQIDNYGRIVKTHNKAFKFIGLSESRTSCTHCDFVYSRPDSLPPLLLTPAEVDEMYKAS